MHADAKQDKGYACKVLSNYLRSALFGFYTKNCDITVTGASFMTVRTRQLISQSFVFATF